MQKIKRPRMRSLGVALNRTKKYFVFVLVLLAAQHVLAQSRTITGKVITEKTGEPKINDDETELNDLSK